ncbi:c-type cytochrome [Azotobacter chroococcum]|jgi:mono/diheme cytochrome c family protein|uniref:Mono/diheme cytochrome c family protein n=1 Tax=Azotobacter chroococcum TaxID=353 RepID=A0A4R1PK17_9GAMM|nr:cytochrome c [Azotobacter chroococcum]TBV97549.1 cytochrome c [Azotobacter chroococcum]TCL28096.1 mono/diheme cytochrome c family protein [Azotobacter chroococcum]
MRHLATLAFLLIASLPLAAAELSLELPGGTHRWSSAELLAHPQIRSLSIPADPTYRRGMHYRALPLAVLLDGVGPGDHLQAQALDGFAAELPAAPLLRQEGARAWLAIEDPASPWPALGEGKPSAGPFYLVWSDPQMGDIGPEQWPFQIARIRLLAPLAERFPALLPAADADASIQAGFVLFQKHCLACHRLNGQGDARFGPDLNLPYNPTEYFHEAFLRRYIRDPQGLRQWSLGRMPGFSAEVLTEDELDRLLAYLRHMAGRKAGSR